MIKNFLSLIAMICLMMNMSYARGSEVKDENTKTKIFMIFLSQGYHDVGGPVRNPMSNQEVLQKLQKECQNVQFIVRDLSTDDLTHESLLKELEELKDNLDGVLIIGTLHHYKLAFNGLPTILVYNLWEFNLNPYMLFATGGKSVKEVMVGGTEYKDGRILTAQLDRLQVCDPEKSAEMFKDLTDKIKLIEAIKKLKDARILSISPHHNLHQVDFQGDNNKQFPENYNETYIQTVNELLGVEIIRIEPEEFYKAYKEADIKEAEKHAEKWIKDAAGVEAAKSEIVKNARAYLAYDALLEKYNCNALSTHMRSLTGSDKAEDIFFPGLGLECGFKTRGIPAVCQDYPNIIIPQILAFSIAGRPSKLGDLMIDKANAVDIILHCGAPINPYGDDRIVPYFIKTHAQSPLRATKEPGSGTGMQVMWPIGERVTVWKVYPLLKKIGAHTGTLVDGYAIYKNYEDLVCRNKLIIKVDNIQNVQDHYHSDAYGIHRNVTLGDYKQQIKDLATLMGFEFMDEDLPLQINR